ncbi:MAG: flagellar basal body-associated FliL family protein, partial [Desulfobacteraceae bacterium]|nr:flagellar basal body-associated FliL family protein [Desulfobacteraceae bacterium]
KDKVEIVEAERNRIRNVVRSVTAEMRWIELRSSEGKIKFKYILIKKLNLLFPDIVIRNLYLTHFIMR